MLAGHFARFASHVAVWAGKPSAFLIALSTIIIWAIWGPFVGYSENWQLIINTGTTIVTFLMVFLIQNSQNRESVAIEIKLNEILRAHRDAKNILFDVEELSYEELDRIRSQYQALAEKLRNRGEVTGSPPLDVKIAIEESARTLAGTAAEKATQKRPGARRGPHGE